MSKYENIREQLKTGDVVLFSGKGKISFGIKMFTLSEWSHVGMVLKLPESKTIFLWEATTLSNLQDAVDGIAKRGVQLVLLSERVRTYEGKIAIRQLENYEIDKEEYMKIMELRKQLKNRPYENDYIELIKSAYDGPLGHNDEDLSSIFCSELVAEAYQTVKLLKPNEIGGQSSNEFTPKDFSSQNKKLKLLKGAKLGKEIIIKNA